MQPNGLVLMKSNCVPVSLQDTPNVCSGNKQDAIVIWPKEEYAGRNELRYVNLDGGGQDVLDGLVPEEMAITRRTEAILALKSGQDSKGFYRAKRQAIWPEVWNKGPRKADKIVLESPDLRQWNISITEVYANCPGTKPGSSRIRCELNNENKGFYAWSKITLALGATSSSRIVLPLIQTSYVKDAGSTDTSIFPQPRAITVHAAPVAEQERARLRRQMKWADFQPTGFYLNPETSLTITASGIDTNRLKPEILVGTPALVHPDRRDEQMPAQLEASKPLKNGANTISSRLGGIIYIRYVKQAGQSRRPIAVSLGNTAQPFPLFRQGVTTDNQWKAMLRATKVPFAEQSGEHVIITGLAADAKIHAEKGQEQQALLSTYTDIIGAQDKKVFDDAYVFTKLVMLEQVRVAFGGDRFYHEMHKRSRSGPIQAADANVKHYFMTLAAQIAGKNLSGYFTKWGLKPEPRTLEEMSKYPLPTRDYTTVPVYGGR
ncbi:hypothetical protein MGU_10534 [Metarhizium guizhouense ARSEF 977]|uniref:Peptidase M60 domain-containing protein n=1 Tax=Metarhizium guizhouense (strain ARSEF 977) TaxID=1276136 RepID=A0A0B4HRQ1_METGA|nr:hypothetical protein MGU_10534 [Metarhizium guizhouense ARSEF 977]